MSDPYKITLDPAFVLNIYARKSNKLTKTWKVRDQSGTDYNFTSHTGTFKVWDQPGGTEISVSGSVTFSGQSLTIEITEANMNQDADRYYYEVAINDGTNIYTWLNGFLEISLGTVDQPEADSDEIMVNLPTGELTLYN